MSINLAVTIIVTLVLQLLSLISKARVVTSFSMGMVTSIGILMALSGTGAINIVLGVVMTTFGFIYLVTRYLDYHIINSELENHIRQTENKERTNGQYSKEDTKTDD